MQQSNPPTAMLNSTTSPALREKSPCKSRSEKTISSSTSSLSGKVKTIFPCSGSFCRFAADLLRGRSTVPWYLTLLTSSNFTVPSGSLSTCTATSLPCLESVLNQFDDIWFKHNPLTIPSALLGQWLTSHKYTVWKHQEEWTTWSFTIQNIFWLLLLETFEWDCLHVSKLQWQQNKTTKYTHYSTEEGYAYWYSVK